MKTELTVLALCALFSLLGPRAAEAQTDAAHYPSRPIRIVVPFPPGGATDIMGRTLGQKLTQRWGQQVIIDNRPGAGGNIAAELAARAAPDGHTLFFAASAQLAVNPNLYAKVPYDPIKNFAAVVLVGSGANIVVAHPSLSVRSLKELIALAKSKPGLLQYASPGSGSTAHLSAELLKIEAGIDIVHVPYKGAAPGVIDVLGGQVPLMFVSMPSVLGHVKASKLVALGVTSARRSDAAPDVPTFAETIPRFESSSWYGIVAPANSPRDVIAKLNAAVLASLKAPDVREIFAAQGTDIIGSTPEEFARYIKAELAKWAIVVKKSGARVD
ncbi:MAG: putative Bug-like extracytoplasmic solute binding receptor, family [Betaproteobacteria bacterium]|nr:putative Bug-like extracytoplasmic solute binding receptor, family [Betaproteobacteria bacterium]